MEFTDLNQENLVSITFMDVMKIISSEETTPNQKLVYIYLLNTIMDTNERIDKLETTIKELESENDYELIMERRGKPSTEEDEDDDEPHMVCPLCDGEGHFVDEDEDGLERMDCGNCCGEGYVIFNEDEQDIYPDGKCIDTINEDVKWYEDNVKGDGEQIPF